MDILIILLLVILAIGYGVYKIVLKPILFEPMPEFQTDDRLYDLFGIHSPGFQESPEAAEQQAHREHAARVLRAARTKFAKAYCDGLASEDPQTIGIARAEFDARWAAAKGAVRAQYGGCVLRSALLKLELYAK